MGITDNKYIFLFIVNIVFLLLGCVLDVSTIQLVFVPMVLPLVQAMGIDLVHFGVVICLNMMIGLSTPPFGMLLFIVSGLGKTKIKGVIREILARLWSMPAYAVVYCFGSWKNEDQGCHTGDFADGAYYDRAVVPGYLCTGYYYVYT